MSAIPAPTPTTLNASKYVTLAETFEVVAPYPEACEAVRAAVKRLETDGISALVSAQFFLSPESTEAGATISFSDRDLLMTHINMISGWEEFSGLIKVMKPVEIKVFGELPAEAAEWISRWPCVIKRYDQHVAGFVRHQ